MGSRYGKKKRRKTNRKKREGKKEERQTVRKEKERNEGRGN